MGKVRRCLEQRAYGAMTREEEAKQKLEQLRRTGRGDSRQKLIARMNTAKKESDQAIERHDQFEGAMNKTQEAMEFADLKTGTLRLPAQCETQIVEAAKTMHKIDDPKAKKAGRYIENRAPGLAMYMAQLWTQLQPQIEDYGKQSVVLACIIWRLMFDLGRNRRLGERTRKDDEQYLLGAMGMLRELLGAQADELLKTVHAIFVGRHRASSAIEGFNAALRPYLYVHKGVTQGFLELFRAYYNLRTRRWGRFKGTSPHQSLNGEVVDDWLSLLGYPPSSPSVAVH
jgi:hypothetical protein